eukprot:PLAT10411.1.p1 GENE.PLAT10411.1~~PLAT10411.1.p1  ORF type:complete len:615 (+),score=129.40 PLAT10411.1:77-1846(+)
MPAVAPTPGKYTAPEGDSVELVAPAKHADDTEAGGASTGALDGDAVRALFTTSAQQMLPSYQTPASALKVPAVVAALSCFLRAPSNASRVRTALLVLSAIICVVFAVILQVSAMPYAVNRAAVIIFNLLQDCGLDLCLTLGLIVPIWAAMYPALLTRRQWMVWATYHMAVMAMVSLVMNVGGFRLSDITYPPGSPRASPAWRYPFAIISALVPGLSLAIEPTLLMLSPVRRLFCLQPFDTTGLFKWTGVKWPSFASEIVVSIGLVGTGMGYQVVLFFTGILSGILVIGGLLHDNKRLDDGKVSLAALYLNVFYAWRLIRLVRDLPVTIYIGTSVLAGVRAMPGGEIMLITVVQLAVAALRRMLNAVARRLFGDRADNAALRFALQIADDFMTGLVFLGSRVDNPLFWLALVVNVLRQLQRDTGLLSRAVRACLRKPVKVETGTMQQRHAQWELRWRLQQQTAITELIASFGMPLLVLLDASTTVTGAGTAVFVEGMTAEEKVQQLAALLVLLLAELGTHVVSGHYQKKQLQEHVRAMVGDDVKLQQQALEAHSKDVDAYWLRNWPLLAGVLVALLPNSIFWASVRAIAG